MGGDFTPLMLKLQVYRFNPRPRMGGDLEFIDDTFVDGMFQSTPPHGGRLFGGILSTNIFAVSIHAPAWGATDAC